MPKTNKPLHLFVILLLLAAAALVSACSTGAAPTTAPSAAPAATAAAPTAAPASIAAASPAPTTVALPTQAAASPAPTTVALPTQAAAPTSAPTQAKATVTVAPALPVGDPREAVLQAARAQFKAGPYRVKSTTTTDKGVSERTAEVILPDRFHISTRIGQTPQEFIIIGSKTYRKAGDKWSEFPIEIGSLVAEFVNGLTEEAAKGITDVKLVGPDLLNGVPTLVYTYNVQVNLGGTIIKSAVKSWISVANGLTVRQEVEGEAGGIKSRTIQVIEYDPSIKIEPPI